MALTDPELDLLLELLAEDPTSEVFVQVGEELVRRARWPEAHRVLHTGTFRQRASARALAALARAALEAGEYSDALTAVSRIRQRVPELPQSLAHVEVLALERAGRYAEARDKVDHLITLDPTDVVATAAEERLAAPPPDIRLHARDPYYTVARAERYVDAGRSDRAVRTYRRILFKNEDDQAITRRLGQLAAAPHDPVDDDLSEELTDPGLVPPHLGAPRPMLRDLRRATPLPEEFVEVPLAPASEYRGLVELVIEGDLDDLDMLEPTKGRP